MRIGSYWDFSSSLKTSHVFNLCKTKSYILKSRSWFHCVTSLGINSSEAWPLHALLWPHIFEWKRQKSLTPGDTLVWLNINFRICAGISSWFSSPLNNFSLVDDWNTEGYRQIRRKGTTILENLVERTYFCPCHAYSTERPIAILPHCKIIFYNYILLITEGSRRQWQKV